MCLLFSTFEQLPLSHSSIDCSSPFAGSFAADASLAPSVSRRQTVADSEERKKNKKLLGRSCLKLIHAYLSVDSPRLWICGPSSVCDSYQLLLLVNMTNEATAVGVDGRREDAVAVCCQEIPVLVQLFSYSVVQLFSSVASSACVKEKENPPSTCKLSDSLTTVVISLIPSG